ncbi:ferredoxin III, nif-specific [Methylomonas sp. AM2-LC]|uniref:ferredoxin III, nif-specific n=1 Tax=Methylomonas sp. AM2-LC TaxID=3153301 RepID=UPI003265F5FD
MTEFVTGTTFGGTVWTPAYVTDLNARTCIGCGRCFKVCPRDVFDLVDRDDVLEAEDFGDDYADFEDDDNTQVMVLKNAADCIGCEACSKVCPKDCFTHQHKSLT